MHGQYACAYGPRFSAVLGRGLRVIHACFARNTQVVRAPDRRVDDRFGLVLCGTPALFSEQALPEGLLDGNQMHAYMGEWISESILGVLREGTYRQ